MGCTYTPYHPGWSIIIIFYALTQILHALALACSLTFLVVSSVTDVRFTGTGGAVVVTATIVLSYEIIMIILVFVNNVNHQLRLLVVSVIMHTPIKTMHTLNIHSYC